MKITAILINGPDHGDIMEMPTYNSMPMDLISKSGGLYELRWTDCHSRALFYSDVSIIRAFEAELWDSVFKQSKKIEELENKPL